MPLDLVPALRLQGMLFHLKPEPQPAEHDGTFLVGVGTIRRSLPTRMIIANRGNVRHLSLFWL